MARRAHSAFRPTETAPLFAALGDATRLGILARLCHRGPLSIAELTRDTGVTRQAISKHLRALERAGLARGLRVGRTHVFRIEPRRLGEMRQYLDQISARWDAALERLRLFVESERH